MDFDFLFCSERSGSNLITKIMNAHPDICGPSPTHALRVFCHQYFRYGDLRNDAHWRVLIDDAGDICRTPFPSGSLP